MTMAARRANKTDAVFLRWTMSLPSLMDESTTRCYRSGDRCLRSAAPNRALARDFDAKFAPRPGQMPPILGEIVTRYGRLKVPHRQGRCWSGLLASTYDISQKTDDRPTRPLVHLLAH